MIQQLYHPFFAIVVTWLTIFCCLWVMIRRSGAGWLISLPGFFMVIYIVFNVIGAPFLIREYDPANIKYLLALNLCLVIHTLVYSTTEYGFGFSHRREMSAFVSRPAINQDEDSIPYRSLFAVLFLITVVTAAMYVRNLPRVPLMELFSNPAVGAALASSRADATSNFVGKYWRYYAILKLLLPMISLLAMSLASYRKNRFWITAFLIVFAFCIFIQLIDLQKAPIVFYLLSVMVMRYLLHGRMRTRTLLLFGLVTLTLLVVMYVYIMGVTHGGVARIARGISLRLFLAQTLGTQEVFRLFPDIHPFLMGTSFPNPAHLMPYDVFELDKYVFSRAFGVGSIEGTAPCTYYMEFYANFGFPAMIASMFVGAFLLQFTQILLIRMPKSALTTSFFGFLTVYASHAAIGSASTVFGTMFILLIIVLLCFHFLRMIFKDAL
jgi:oligosaccharide repeat unit polymerase